MSHPRDPEAGEFVLGTLAPAEREAFERDLARDPTLRQAVADWERRLFPLCDPGAAEAPAAVWQAIERHLSQEPASAQVVALDSVRASRRNWRFAALTAGALAASLAVFLVAERTADAVRPGERFVAVVNRGGSLPALIIKVDARAGRILVRPLSVERPTDRSLELWYIGPGQAPRSLGTVDDPVKVSAIAYGDPIQPDATLAVTVEPVGGSPTKGPTGPVVYSGRLLPDDR